MLQYLINLSGIWLLCLVVFDLFLKRESYHGYNRLYLNISILLGVFLPLWSWQGDSIIYATEISGAVATQAAAIKEQVVSSTNTPILGWETILWTIYIAGAGISLILLVRELITIIRLISTGKRSKSGVWTVIETQQPVSPFSAFRYVFVDSLDSYTEEELSIILTHEKQHGHLLHFIDLLFVNLVKIIFWFHPLIYVLEKRLLMIHEYQADQVVESQPDHYGQFLIEQSMLRTAPALSHSFIRSPLKNRIMMLTRKSGKIASGKKLFIIPLIITTAICFTQLNSALGQQAVIDGNTITYNGNKFEKAVGVDDTVYVDDPVTGETSMVLTRREGPIVKMNDKDVLSDYYLNSRPIEIAQTINKIKAEVSSNIIHEVNNIQQSEGATFSYYIHNLVIDETGKVVYYELAGTKYIRSSKDGTQYEIPETIRKAISQKITNVLQDVNATIMHKDGKPIPYVLYISDEFSIE